MALQKLEMQSVSQPCKLWLVSMKINISEAEGTMVRSHRCAGWIATSEECEGGFEMVISVLVCQQ